MYFSRYLLSIWWCIYHAGNHVIFSRQCVVNPSSVHVCLTFAFCIDNGALFCMNIFDASVSLMTLQISIWSVMLTLHKICVILSPALESYSGVWSHSAVVSWSLESLRSRALESGVTPELLQSHSVLLMVESGFWSNVTNNGKMLLRSNVTNNGYMLPLLVTLLRRDVTIIGNILPFGNITPEQCYQ